MFHCIGYTFYIWEQLALALKNRGSPEFTVLNIYLLLFKIFEQLALALKNRVALEFFTVLNMYFLSFRIFERLALALKNRVTLEFFTPRIPRFVRLCVWIYPISWKAAARTVRMVNMCVKFQCLTLNNWGKVLKLTEKRYQLVYWWSEPENVKAVALILLKEWFSKALMKRWSKIYKQCSLAAL